MYVCMETCSQWTALVSTILLVRAHLQAQAATKADSLKADIPVGRAIVLIVISPLLFLYFVHTLCMYACMYVCLYICIEKSHDAPAVFWIVVSHVCMRTLHIKFLPFFFFLLMFFFRRARTWASPRLHQPPRSVSIYKEIKYVHYYFKMFILC